MLNFIVRRLILTLLVLIILSFLVFSLLQIMPGDPVSGMLGIGASREQIAALRHELWLDRPFLVQYWHWAWNALHFNFGVSIMYGIPISKLITARLPITLYLSILALIISAVLGIAGGIFCAVKRGGIFDQLISLFANVGIAIPVFWLGILAIYFFGLKLRWLPIQGWTSPFVNFTISFKQSLMPVILLSIPSLAMMTRQTRSSMLEVIRQDYIRTAWSKGLKEKNIVIGHALKNALIPAVTLLGLNLRVLVGGSVLVETVFNIPGMGRLLTSGAVNKDFLVVQAGVLLVGMVVCVANLLVDISYGWLDPRIKYG